jgi:hypothetical protein
MSDQDLERIEKLILAEWISPLRELDRIIEQRKDDEKYMAVILDMAARIGRKNLNAALHILNKVIYSSAPGAALEKKAVNQWRKTIETAATKDIFNALSGAASSATLDTPGHALKKTAIGAWKNIFDKAAIQKPDQALEYAERALMFVNMIRSTEAFGPESTEEFEDVLRHARDMLEIKILLRRAGPQP